jgi:hypothetical protein
MPKSFAATEHAWSKSNEISSVSTLNWNAECAWAKARIEAAASPAEAQAAVATKLRRVICIYLSL